MTDNKLTDNEIIKALECCVSEQYTCGQCPFQEIKHYDDDYGFEIMPNGKRYDDWSCERWLNVALLDLINRLQAEIEHIDNESSALLADIDFRENEINRLQAENEKLEKNIETETNHITRLENQIERLLQRIKTIKAEAYQEFANEIFELFPADKPNTVISRVTVKHILKELVGENKWAGIEKRK